MTTERIGLQCSHLTPAQLLGRLEISTGTVIATDADFEVGAVIAGPWRQMSQAEFEAIFADQLGGSGDTVALVSFADDTLDCMRNLRGSTSYLPRKERPQLETSPEIRAFLTHLSDVSPWVSSDPIKNAGFHSGAAPDPHTTIVFENGLHVGLHFDMWDRLAPSQRVNGQNRLCLNISHGDRALQFVPVPSRNIAAQLTSIGIDLSRDNGLFLDHRRRSDLDRRYMREFPDQPVVRMLVRPGEAYIAPTENLIHDGSAFSTVGSDDTFTVRGHFSLSPITQN